MTADTPPPSRRIVVALGSNLGERAAYLAFAIVQLRSHLAGLRISSLVETPAEGVPDPQPPYLNAVGVGESRQTAAGLLAVLRSIENAAGRRRDGWRSARTLDLDLILAGSEVASTPDLELPHPRFRERLFVLGPLAEVAPDLCDPVTGLSVRRLVARARRLSA